MTVTRITIERANNAPPLVVDVDQQLGEFKYRLTVKGTTHAEGVTSMQPRSDIGAGCVLLGDLDCRIESQRAAQGGAA